MIFFPKCFPRALESTTTSSMCPTLPQFLKNFFSINTLPVAMIFPEASSSITPMTWSSPTALSSRNRSSKSLSETESQTLSCCSNSMKPLLLSEISNFRTPYFCSSLFSILSCEIQTESQNEMQKLNLKQISISERFRFFPTFSRFDFNTRTHYLCDFHFTPQYYFSSIYDETQ